VSTFNATSVLNQFHANLALITTASPGTLTRSAYRFTLDKEPDSGPDGLYFVDITGADAYERKWGSGETIITGRVSVRTAYFRGGGSAGGGDRRAVMRNASDDCQLIADVCENPDNYNSSASGIRSIIFEGFSRVADLPRSEVWETRFTVQWRSDLQTLPVQDFMVASIIADTLSDLSALNVKSLAAGTGAVVTGTSPFSVYLLDKDNDAGDAADGDEILDTTGATGAVWRRHATTTSQVWSGSGGSYKLPVDTVGGLPIGVTIETQAAAADAEMFRIVRRGVDISTGAAQNGTGVIGSVFPAVNDLSHMNKCDAGDYIYALYGGPFQKLIPTVHGSNYLLINSEGAPAHITRLVQNYIPHLPLNPDGPNPVTVGEVIGLFMDGSADLNGNITCTGRRLSIRTGHGIAADRGFWAGDSAQSTDGGFVDFADGTNALPADVGHGRIVYITGVGFGIKSEGQVNTQPLAGGITLFQNYDPSARTYPVGDTVVHSIVPSDTSQVGLQGIQPIRWTLPAQISLGGGGSLVAGIRFNENNGSSAGPIGLQNGTGSSVSVARDSVFLAMTGTWITSIDLIVTNTSSGTSSSQDVGNFQFEGSCW